MHQFFPLLQQEVTEWLLWIRAGVSTQPRGLGHEPLAVAKNARTRQIWRVNALQYDGLYCLQLINFEKDVRSSLVAQPLSIFLWSVCPVAFWANTPFISHGTSCYWNGKNCLIFSLGLGSWEFDLTPTDKKANKTAPDIRAHIEGQGCSLAPAPLMGTALLLYSISY